MKCDALQLLEQIFEMYPKNIILYLGTPVCGALEKALLSDHWPVYSKVSIIFHSYCLNIFFMLLANFSDSVIFSEGGTARLES